MSDTVRDTIFEDWFGQLVAYADKNGFHHHVFNRGKEAFREYYMDGLTVEDTIEESMNGN